MPPSGTGQSTHFLNTVLSQRGPSALPYEEDIKWYIRQHLVSLKQEFPSLDVKTSIFTHNDGRTVNLLEAQGTIPMVYQQVTYNIPVTIWLLESYSRQSPLVYVTPTRDMVVKRGHPFVDPSGLVSSPYIRGWIFPSSNLVDMVRNLSILFGQHPPLYTKQRAVSNQNHGLGAPGSHAPMSTSGHLNNPRRTSIPPRPNDDQIKNNEINKLVESFHKDMAELRKAREVEIDAMFSIQATLRQRGEKLDKGVGELQQEKEDLEEQLQSILTSTDVLETWLQMNKSKQPNFDIDDVYKPCDVLSKQLLESSTADLVIEDILYSLDKAVQDGAIPVEAYLKNVRALSREQFFHRAMSSKVTAAELEAQVAHMAARPGSYVS